MIQNAGTAIFEQQTDPCETISTILLVDDRPENLLTLESVLKNGKRIFFKAQSGNEALKIALCEPITLIMMDIQMPDMDGLETSRLLRLNSRTKHIPILFVSAINPKEKHPLEGFEPGTVDYLFKPLNLEETKTKVRLFENIWHSRQESERLKKTNEKLTRDFDKFVYLVSHDLKAPLRAIGNLATWITEDLGGTAHPNVNENLTLMQERVLRLNLMIDGILEYSRVGRIEESPVNIKVDKMVQAVFESLQPSGDFSLKMTGTWPDLYTEKIKIEKIFRQLIQNAMIHHDRLSGVVTINAARNGRWMFFSVSDDGPGIKPIDYNTVFEMFQTLQPKDDRNNNGTGLAIVRKLVENQGGTITVSKHQPRGATFEFTWPC